MLLLDLSSGVELSRADHRPGGHVVPNVHGAFVVALKQDPEADYLLDPTPAHLDVTDGVTGAHWQVPIDRSIAGRGAETPFAASDGRAYAFVRNDLLAAFDSQTGREIWFSDAVIGHLAAGDGYVFVSSNAKITALESSREYFGVARWSASLPGPISHLTEADRRLYAIMSGPPVTVVSFDAIGGQELWRTQVPLSAARPITVTGDRLVVVGFVQGSSLELTLDRETGRELSRADRHNLPPLEPDKHGDFVVSVVPPDPSPEINVALHVGDTRTGAGWHVPADRAVLDPQQDAAGPWPRGSYDIPFAASDGQVYAFPRPDKLTAYDAPTGTVMWEADVATGFLAAGDGYVVVSSNDRVTALDSSGAVQWSASLPGPSWYLIEANGRVYATRPGRFAERCVD